MALKPLVSGLPSSPAWLSVDTAPLSCVPAPPRGSGLREALPDPRGFSPDRVESVSRTGSPRTRDLHKRVPQARCTEGRHVTGQTGGCLSEPRPRGKQAGGPVGGPVFTGGGTVLGPWGLQGVGSWSPRGRQQEGCLRLGRLRTPPPPPLWAPRGPCELAQEREEGCQEGTWQLPGPETWPVLRKDFLPGTGSGLMWCQAPVSENGLTPGWPWEEARAPGLLCEAAQLGRSTLSPDRGPLPVQTGWPEPGERSPSRHRPRDSLGPASTPVHRAVPRRLSPPASSPPDPR